MNRRTLIGGAIAAVAGLFTKGYTQDLRTLTPVARERLMAGDWTCGPSGPATITYNGVTVTMPLALKTAVIDMKDGHLVVMTIVEPEHA